MTFFHVQDFNATSTTPQSPDEQGVSSPPKRFPSIPINKYNHKSLLTHIIILSILFLTIVNDNINVNQSHLNLHTTATTSPTTTTTTTTSSMIFFADAISFPSIKLNPRKSLKRPFKTRAIQPSKTSISNKRFSVRSMIGKVKGLVYKFGRGLRRFLFRGKFSGRENRRVGGDDGINEIKNTHSNDKDGNGNQIPEETTKEPTTTPETETEPEPSPNKESTEVKVNNVKINPSPTSFSRSNLKTIDPLNTSRRKKRTGARRNGLSCVFSKFVLSHDDASDLNSSNDGGGDEIKVVSLSDLLFGTPTNNNNNNNDNNNFASNIKNNMKVLLILPPLPLTIDSTKPCLSTLVNEILLPDLKKSITGNVDVMVLQLQPLDLLSTFDVSVLNGLGYTIPSSSSSSSSDSHESSKQTCQIHSLIPTIGFTCSPITVVMEHGKEGECAMVYEGKGIGRVLNKSYLEFSEFVNTSNVNNGRVMTKKVGEGEELTVRVVDALNEIEDEYVWSKGGGRLSFKKIKKMVNAVTSHSSSPSSSSSMKSTKLKKLQTLKILLTNIQTHPYTFKYRKINTASSFVVDTFDLSPSMTALVSSSANNNTTRSRSWSSIALANLLKCLGYTATDVDRTGVYEYKGGYIGFGNLGRFVGVIDDLIDIEIEIESESESEVQWEKEREIDRVLEEKRVNENEDEDENDLVESSEDTTNDDDVEIEQEIPTPTPTPTPTPFKIVSDFINIHPRPKHTSHLPPTTYNKHTTSLSSLFLDFKASKLYFPILRRTFSSESLDSVVSGVCLVELLGGYEGEDVLCYVTPAPTPTPAIGDGLAVSSINININTANDGKGKKGWFDRLTKSKKQDFVKKNQTQSSSSSSLSSSSSSASLPKQSDLKQRTATMQSVGIFSDRDSAGFNEVDGGGGTVYDEFDSDYEAGVEEGGEVEEEEEEEDGVEEEEEEEEEE